MADLNDRGQIILIAGFALAVIFIGFAVVVNAAIFTGNLATRGETTGASDALLYRHEAEESVANIVTSLNENNVSDLSTKAERNIEENQSVQGGIQNARRGRVVAIEFVTGSARVEARLFQDNSSRSFTNASGEANWTLAGDAPEIRNVELNVSTDDLAEVTTENRSDAFNLVINDSSDQWNMSVYEPNGTADDMNVTVDDAAGNSQTCTANGAFVVINVTDGTVGGAPCTELSDGFPSSNTTRFRNGDKIAGNYSISLTDPEGIRARDFNESASPVADVNITRLEVTLTYEAASLSYETTFEVTPDDV